ncbi:hypothetical protein [Novosphingobium terrae]|uniref:hypothetical protein n=1 Tax=Novosphingobium terrae TaxID=2726189 RepID=UPI00389A6B7B
MDPAMQRAGWVKADNVSVVSGPKCDFGPPLSQMLSGARCSSMISSRTLTISMMKAAVPIGAIMSVSVSSSRTTG